MLAALGGHSAFGRLGVPPDSPSFADMRSVTSAWDCTRKHIAVLPVNPCDPWRRPANYPQIWLLPAFLGLGQSSTIALGFLAAVVFFAAALLIIPPSARLMDGLIFGFALCAPAVMLGIERGNVDILLFALVALAASLVRRGRKGMLRGTSMLVFAAILKLYPIFALPALIRRARRHALVATIAGTTVFAIYIGATFSYTEEIVRTVPQTDSYSYGINLVGAWLSSGFSVLPGTGWNVVIIIATAVIALRLRSRLRPRLTLDESDAARTRDLDYFWSGGCIYVASFALFRSYDYRLVFVLLTIPQLLRWTREGSRVAVAVLTALGLTLWSASPWTGVPVLGTVTSWIERKSVHPPFTHELAAAGIPQVLLFIGVSLLLIASAPPVNTLLPRRGFDRALADA